MSRETDRLIRAVTPLRSRRGALAVALFCSLLFALSVRLLGADPAQALPAHTPTGQATSTQTTPGRTAPGQATPAQTDSAQTGPALATSSSKVGASCAWRAGAIGKQRFGNSDFIDTAVTYLIMPFGYHGGSELRIHGLFPRARYISFSTYAGTGQTLVDHLTDVAIAPDPGSSNPFRPSPARASLNRWYTITVRQAHVPAHGRAPNTLYTGDRHPVFLIYRVYAPDRGADVFGGVPKPDVSTVQWRAHGAPLVVALPACAPLQATHALFRMELKLPGRWVRFNNRGTGSSNADEAYVQARLDRSDHPYVIRFKAPTFADTYHGRTISGHEEVRYWSLCVYAMLSTKVVACLHDYQAVRGHDGTVTVVLSTYAHKPRRATRANGVNWLPFGPERIAMITYRELLPAASFRGSIARAPLNARQPQLQRALGVYLPSIQRCSAAKALAAWCG